ncbi:MAG: DUF2461 domain-containing protein [Bacteroidetes bacterium]|nr:DUF2461 domain-containing protein [Bacteroidota bacterium]MDA1121647.1 DUF2461 domain-containing protein [Bacteroidota bacterium]
MENAHVLGFLTQLSLNNNREWFEANRDNYETARNFFVELVQELINGIALFDPGISGLQAKKCIFRLHRDVRFSKNKSPYKLNFGASMSEGGKKSIFPSYYIHLQPGGQCFIGGGLYHPEAENLKRVRQEIDYNSDHFISIIEDASFKKLFGDIWGDRLKRPPKGYPEDHPQIEYLKFKDYVLLHNLNDDEIIDKDFVKKSLKVYTRIKPFNDFIRAALS